MADALGAIEAGLSLVATIVQAAKKPPEVSEAIARRRAVSNLALLRQVLATTPRMGRKRRLRLTARAAGWVAWLRAVGLDDFGRPLQAEVPIDPKALMALLADVYKSGYEDGGAKRPLDPTASDAYAAVEVLLEEAFDVLL